MRKAFGLLMVILLLISAAAADSEKGNINVFSEANDVDIYIDNILINKGQKAVLNNIDPGKHFVKCVASGEVIFSEFVDVEKNETSSVLVKNPVQIVEAVTKEVESTINQPQARSIKEYLGLDEEDYKKFGIGLEVGWPFYGYTVQYWPVKQHGFSLSSYNSNSYSYGNVQHLSFKYKYRLSDNTFLSLGYGKYSDRRYDYYTYDTADYSENLLGVFFGIMSNYTTFELGYGHKTASDGKSSGIITASSGIYFLF